MEYYTVYKITNLVNDKIYIGAHKTSNLDDGYMGSGKIIKRAVEKYGIENFEKEILEVFESSDEMFEMESKLVTKDFIKEDTNYNLKEGGFGGFDYLNRTGLNMRNHNYIEMSKKGVITLEELNQCSGYKSEQSIKISNGMKNFYTNGGVNPKGFLGKTHSIETKIKMSEFQKVNQLGERNSQFGTKWIYNLELKVSKKIPKDLPIPMGWLKGRKISFVEKPKKIKLCKKCGCEVCDRPTVCNKHQMIKTLINLFNFNKDLLGTNRFYEEFDKVSKSLSDEYHIDKKSTIEIASKYGISTQRLDSIFKSLNISLRSRSEALKNFVSKK